MPARVRWHDRGRARGGSPARRRRRAAWRWDPGVTGRGPGRWVIVAELRDAEVTIVGGGAIGCAVAYCLARAGYRDIQIVERGELAAAISSQAAGLVAQVRSSPERTRMAMASVALYSRIEQETGYTA